MYRGKFKMFNTQKGFGFISSLEFPGNIFTHTNSIWLPPGEFPSGGDECTFDVGSDRYGRPVATNVQITRRVEDHAARVHHLEPERRQYQTRVMHPSGRLSSSPRHPEEAERRECCAAIMVAPTTGEGKNPDHGGCPF